MGSIYYSRQKKINLGVFDEFNKAAEIRKNAEIKYFGDYRYINHQNEDLINTEEDDLF